MPYKRDDFQELFQKAGSDYPLRTDNSDWDNVAARLNATANGPKAPNSRFLKYAFVFLLFLSASFIFYRFQFYTAKIAVKQQDTKQHTNLKAEDKFNELNINNDLAPAGITADLNFKDFKSYKNQNSSILSAKGNGISVAITSTEKKVSIINGDMNGHSPLKLNERSTARLEQPSYRDQTTNIISKDKELGDLNSHTTVSNDAKTGNVKLSQQLVKFRPLPSKFYGTFYASPEFSMVKFQKIDEPGYKLGVALGYSINKRFDIEIGLQREHINFYSDGKYFESSALPIKSDDAVLSNIDGSSKITSVPVTLKYNFVPKKIGHFYAAVGVNVLQITHAEVYDYIVSKNGVERDHAKKYSSVSDPKYFTGIIASAGYEMKVCNWFNIKAEPYYQIPIQSFGVGKLPVTSFGINVGVVKRLN